MCQSGHPKTAVTLVPSDLDIQLYLNAINLTLAILLNTNVKVEMFVLVQWQSQLNASHNELGLGDFEKSQFIFLKSVALTHVTSKKVMTPVNCCAVYWHAFSY